jgi:preprotein translocase subunit SecA
MDELKEGIYLRSYAQKDPLVEYKREAFDMFEELIGEINRDSVHFAFKYFPQIIEREVATQDEKLAKEKQAPVLRNVNTTRGMQFTHSDSTPIYNYSQPSEDGKFTSIVDEDGNTKVQTFKRADAKIGRNDLVTVRYKDGTIKKEKFKKVEKDYEAGLCEVI